LANIIGLRVYKFRIHSDHVLQSLDKKGGAVDFLEFAKIFFTNYSNNTFNNGDSKTFRAKLEKPLANTVHGTLR
jgi:hypothetical protein